MTIIITAGNAESVIQFSDRRLSNGKNVVEEHSNKATAFICSDGRFAVGFTGLAKTSGFEFQPWLVDALRRCAPPDFQIIGTINRLILELDLLLSTKPGIRWLPKHSKRLTVMISGYAYRSDGRPYMCTFWVTNFQDFESGIYLNEARPQFWYAAAVEKEVPTGPVVMLQRVGAWNAMTLRDEEILRRVLERSNSIETVINAGVSVVRQISNRPLSANTVGEEVAITIVPSDLGQPMSSRVRLGADSDSITMIDSVTAVPSADGQQAAGLMIRNVTFAATYPTPGKPAIGAMRGPNEKCWCKSGLRFKHCHGARPR